MKKIMKKMNRFWTIALLFLVLSGFLFPDPVAAANAWNIRQEINITDGYFAAPANSVATSSAIIQYDSTKYSGTPTIYFEAVASTSASFTNTITLRRKDTGTDDCTINVPTLTTSYTLIRSSACTLPDGQTEYVVRISSSASGVTGVKAARLIILQSFAGTTASSATSTMTQIEIGNEETYSTTATSTFSSPKYWTYDSSKWDGTASFYAEVTYKVVSGAVASSTLYSTAGTFTVNVPAGTASTSVQLWGAGGAGGPAAANPSGGSGGAGGQYASSTVYNLGGLSRTLVVAATTAGCTSGTCATGASSTWDSAVVVAAGGTGGGQVTASTTGNTTGCVGDTCTAGGGGGRGTTTYGAGGGEGASPAGTGNSSTGAGVAGTGTAGGDGGAKNTTSKTDGTAGTAPGGGGGGAYRAGNGGTLTGGAGGAGQALIVNYIATTTIAIQEDNGSFASWTDKAYIVVGGGAGTPTRARSSAFTPTNGRHYRIAFRNGDSRTSFAIYNAKVIVHQEDTHSWAQSGNGLAVTGVTIPGLTALDSTSVAYADDTNLQIRKYSWSGTDWSLVGSGLSVTGMSVPVLAGLNSTDIAYIDFFNDSLRTYRFNGSTWSQVGNSLSVPSTGQKYITALNSTDIAYINNTEDIIQAYRFDGTNWATLGNSVPITCNGFPAIATLTSSDVVMICMTEFQLKTYHFDGTNWTQTGNSLTLAGTTGGSVAMVGIDKSDIVFVDGTNDSLRTYRWDGVNWANVGTNLAISTVGSPSLTAINQQTIVFIDDTNDNLRTYTDYNSGTEFTKTQPEYLLANTRISSGTSLQSNLTKWDSSEWSGVTNTYLHAVDSANGSASVVTLNTAAGTLLTGSTVTSPSNQSTSTSVTMPASGNLDMKATTNNSDIYGSRILVQVEPYVATIDLSGTVYTTEGGSNIGAGKTIKVYKNGSTLLGSPTTNASGVWSITGAAVNSGDTITAIISGDAVVGNTVVVSDGTTKSNIDVYGGVVAIRHDTGASITSTILLSARGTDADIQYDVAAISKNLTLNSNIELHVWNGSTYAPDAAVTMQGTGNYHLDDNAISNDGNSLTTNNIYIDSGATLTIDSGATISGGVTTTGSGTLTTSGTPTVTMSGTGTLSNSAGTLTFYDLVISGTGNVTGTANFSVNNSLTVDASGSLVMSGGTVTMNNGSSISNSGTLTFSTLAIAAAATVTTSSSFTASGGITVGASGSFTQSSGTATLSGGTVSNSGTLNLNNLTTTGTITNNDAITISGTLTQTSGNIDGSGAISLLGNLSVGASATGGTAKITFSGASTQTLTNSGGTAPTGMVTINKTNASDTVTLASNYTFTNGLVVTKGVFDQGASYNYTTASTTYIGTNGTWSNTGTGDVVLGGNVINAGAITLNSNNGSQCTDGVNDIAITSSVGATQRTWSGAGTFTLYNLAVTDMLGALTTYNSTMTNSNWSNGVCTATVSGTVYTDEGSTAMGSGRTVSIKINGSGTYTTTTAANGTYTISGITMSAGDTITAFLDGATEKAVTVSRSNQSSGTLSGFNLYQNFVIVRDEYASAISNTELDYYDSGQDPDINFTVTAGALTVLNSNTLYVLSGTFTPGGDVTAVVFKQVGGTFNGGSGVITISGGGLTISSGIFNSTSGTMYVWNGTAADAGYAFTHTAGGTFNHNSGTVIWGNGASSQFCGIIDVSTTETFNNFEISTDANGTCEVATGDTLVVLGTYTQTRGGYNTGTIEARGNVVISAFAKMASGVLSFLVTGDQSITSSGGSTSNLNINKSSGIVSVTGDLGIAGLTLSSGTFTSTSGTLTVGSNGNGAWTHSGGTFNHNNGSVKYAGYSTTWDVNSTETFNNLEFDEWAGNDIGSGFPLTIASGDTLIVLGTFTDTDGVVNGGTIQAQGNVVIGSIADGGSTEIQFSGSASQTLTNSGGTAPTGMVTINKTNASDTVTLASNYTFTNGLVVTKGVFSQGASYNYTTASTTYIGASGTWSNVGTGDIVLGGNVTNVGVITLNSNAGSQCTDGTNDIAITSSVGATQRTWSGAGTFTLYNLAVTDMLGALTTYNSTMTNSNWSNGASCSNVVYSAGSGGIDGGSGGGTLVTGGGQSGSSIPSDLTEGGAITSTNTACNVGETDVNAFDNSTASKWCVSGIPSVGTPISIVYDFSGSNSYIVDRYSISAANDTPARDPKDWTFQGCNGTCTAASDTGWVTLDTRTNQFSGVARFEAVTFNFSNLLQYLQYRLRITANNGDGANFQISELQMFQTLSGSGGGSSQGGGSPGAGGGAPAP